MLVQDKKHMTWGVVMTVIFVVILAFMFSKNFQGRTADEKINAFEASDNLFNSISKGSTNYFPMLLKDNQKYMEHSIDMTINLPNKALAQRSAFLLRTSGAEARPSDTQVLVQGDLGRILETALQDSQMLFNNEGQALQNTYDLPGKEVVYVWWNTMDSLERSLTKAGDFKAAKFVGRANKRGVEVGYNFYGIPSQSAADKAGILTFSLIFYVLYTLWWGFAIFFLFEGLGLRMSSGAKKEV